MSTERRLFEVAELQKSSGAAPLVDLADVLIIRVVPDIAAIDKEFDYAVSDGLASEIEVGSIVSVQFNGRIVDAWVVEVGVVPDPRYSLRLIERVLSKGPPGEIVDLTSWVAKRWLGQRQAVLRAASPKKRVTHWPSKRVSRVDKIPTPRDVSPAARLAKQILSGASLSGVVIGAAQPTFEILAPLVAGGRNALIVVPTKVRARFLVGRLLRAGIRAHLFDQQWAAGVSGGVVVGQRSSVWAPLSSDTKLIIVVDEHDEALQSEHNPTWHARDVAVERARRRNARCVLLSPCLSLAARKVTDQIHNIGRVSQRSNWPIVEVADRKKEEPNRYGLFSPRAVEALRESSSGLAVLNRTGRSVMLACQQCGELVRTIDGQHLMIELEGCLYCRFTGEKRPMVCAECTGTSLKRLRLGIGKAAEELAALMGEPVAEITAKKEPAPATRISIGTEAAFYRVKRVETVVFLDFDQELMASRYRVAEHAMASLVRACRVVGGRKEYPEGRVVVQTRIPEHRVLDAASKADVHRMVESETVTRSTLGLPPFGALAEISKDGAAEFVESAKKVLESDPVRWSKTMIMGPRPDGAYLLRSETPFDLSAIISCVDRPAERIRIAADPPRA